MMSEAAALPPRQTNRCAPGVSTRENAATGGRGPEKISRNIVCKRAAQRHFRDNSYSPMKLSINGDVVEVRAAADTPLLWVLRDELGLTGTKYGCGVGLCGACTVQLNGEPVR